jgi:hypothetical protein
MMDATLYKEASFKMNEKTVFIDFFIPPEIIIFRLKELGARMLHNLI